MKSKYTRGSLIHQAIEAIERQPRSPNQLRTVLDNISIARFNQYVTEPLLKDGFALLNGDVMYLTALGREKFSELGMCKSRLPPSHKAEMLHTTYDGKELKMAAVRPGADNHMGFPSRVNDTLRYRDGRVEVMT
jgi:hypothetical protein